MGVEAFLLASTLNVVLAQRLVRKICTACTIKYKPDEAVLKRLSKDIGVDLTNQKFYRGQGCAECNMKGYRGRIGIYEVIAVNERIKTLITQKATSDEIQKAAVEEGMSTMLTDGLDKVASGLTTIEEVIRVIREN
jgi:type II secretory ATPase GspE/PulE/Tfp pilus assembly ATPase PilB-like protein